jgi:hypothetical protein
MDKVAKTILIICIVFSVLFVIGCAFLSLDNMVRSSTWDVSYSDDQANTVSYGGSSGGSSGKSYGASGGGSSVSLTSWKEECAAVALKPEIESCFEIHGEKTINYHTKRIAAESYAYDSLDQLCAAMPSDWRQAIKDAVQRGDSFSSTDLDGNYVTFYTMDKNLPCVSPRDLKSPAARALAESVGTKYYQIIEYDNGQYRFGFWYEYG